LLRLEKVVDNVPADNIDLSAGNIELSAGNLETSHFGVLLL